MPRTEPATGTHFVVERLNWRRGRGDTFYRYPGQARVASFATVAEAEAFRRAEEAKARAAVNPFAGTLAPPTDQTNMPEGVLCDWLLDHGIDPPPTTSGRRDWAKWWETASPHWTADQRAAAWEALDKVRFFRVSERPRRPVAYAVVQVVWGYNDEWFYPGAEGGEVQTLYRSRERAEAEVERRNAEAQENWFAIFDGDDNPGYAPAGANQFDLEGRLLPGQDPFGPTPKPTLEEDEEGDEICTFAPDEMPFYEVIEVELEGVE
ncbi:MAG TPA: hypothetical protein VFG68_05400 [Fimbriiglobus sp.]|nr:hypothetical protein [Fimbriiglobus sp.]